MRNFSDPKVFPRLRQLPPYVFTVTAELKAAAMARGVDVIDLSMGNPDGPTPPPIVEVLRAAVLDGRNHRYLHARGIEPLRRAAAAWYQRRFGVSVDPETEVIATVGAKEGIGHALLGCLGPDEAVLAPTPTYPIHAYGAVLAGGETIPVAVGPGVDFFTALVEAAERSERRARAVVVNFPANPTAVVATPELFEKIVRFAEARDLFIISDIAYCDLVFEGRAPSILEVPGARDRAIELMSLSKSYNMPGWRVGFAAGNAGLITALARVKSYLDYGLFGPIQLAGAAALEGCDSEVAEIRHRYRLRRDALCGHFGAAGWRFPTPPATMYAWAPIPEPLRALGSLEFSRRLIDQAGVAVSPGIGFGQAGDGHVRIALIEDEPRIEQAAERIRDFLARAG
jgi:alanine-synthesizing transaminase